MEATAVELDGGRLREGPLTRGRRESCACPVPGVVGSCPLSGAVVETGGGWVSAVRWERSAGVRFESDAISANAVAAHWDEITRFGTDADHPSTTADALDAATGRG